MSNQVTLGGDRLGSGKKEKIELRNYERSSHDLSYIWRSTMASGTLVPFMSEVGLPGDSFDIDLECDIKTHPTIGPLFGSYKVQLDVFSCPVRLYNAKLHMNALNIGLKMSDIKLPTLSMYAKNTATLIDDNSQINPSCIFSYLGIRGLGRGANNQQEISRKFNAIPYLAYWDIYKQYYANKQEEIGAMIHNDQKTNENNINKFRLKNNLNVYNVQSTNTPTIVPFDRYTTGEIEFSNDNEPDISQIIIVFQTGMQIVERKLQDVFANITWNEEEFKLYCSTPLIANYQTVLRYENNGGVIYPNNGIPKVTTFPLGNIDNMRRDILQDVYSPGAFDINGTTYAPYGLPMRAEEDRYSKLSTQEGLGLKTYQSDLFNNWISTEWLDGTNGINEITAIDTTGGQFTIDTLNLSNKVYEMLNRIAVSGGSYDDWLNAVYSHERTRGVENPMYMGGLIKELGFQEVISNAQAGVENEQPLGTLAGRGVLTKKNKGGKINIRVDEPSYIIGIISLTPRIDYSQGNKWSVNLKTMDDFHKPGLDEIGFQDLITDQMAWWDTTCVDENTTEFKSAGKQPAWINYMTNVNETRGNFAEKSEQMFMTLNRRYEGKISGIKDLTTYIDPSKFNNIFADTRLDAQNFWAQIGVNIYARRKMSAKVMPNL